MSAKVSNDYAPEGTCKYCGFIGKDWGFKYHWTSCTKCYNKWRKEEAAKKKLLNPNENIKIAENLIVTTNVKKRLYKKAHTEIPFSDLYKLSNLIMSIGGIIIFFPLLYTFIFRSPASGTVWFVCIILAGIFIYGFGHIFDKEVMRRNSLVDNHLTQLAQERQKQIEEAKVFYGSPEWRLLRKEIIKSHENVCKNCGKKITEKNDITIDHILPRSKFPKSALEIKNMRILCRSCNSSKGNKIIDMINT